MSKVNILTLNIALIAIIILLMMQPFITYSLTWLSLWEVSSSGSADAKSEEHLNIVIEDETHGYVKVGAPAYFPYNPDRPDSFSASFVVAMVDKEGLHKEEGIDPHYTYDWYSKDETYKPWNEVKVYIKWANKDMSYSDKDKFQNEGWRFGAWDVNNDANSKFTYSFSVTVGGEPASATFTVYYNPIDSNKEGSSGWYDNKLVNGWLYLGKSKVWKCDGGNYDEYVTKTIMTIIGENDYLASHKGQKLLIKVVVIPWWWYSETYVSVFPPDMGGESYYWGIVFTFILGDDKPSNTDANIIIAPSR